MSKWSMEKYRILETNSWNLGGFILKSIRVEEMEIIRTWRNSQIQLLRQGKALSEEDQLSYFRDVISRDLRSDKPSNILVTIWLGENVVGYGGLVHIDWDLLVAEVSFLMGPEFSEGAIHDKSFIVLLEFLTNICVSFLGIRCLTSEVYDIPERSRVLSILKDSGFALSNKLENGIPVASPIRHSLFLEKMLV